MKALLLGVCLAAFLPAALAVSKEDQVTMLGPICDAAAPPPIAGPHRLVRVTGMGNDRLAVDTASPEAQAWFDYGLTLARSFEHGDAILAFQKAEALDPACSLCVWGEAWARGPTINFGVSPGQTATNLALAQKAQGLARPDGSPMIKALEAALIDRYRDPGQAGAGDLAYAHDLDAMTKADPANVEIAVFDAEAWLICENDGDRAAPARAVAVLQPLLASNPNASGLLHFYVHATEEAGTPELAEPYAARLAQLAPMASHMVHMPAHTYYRVGRYEDAAWANVAALETDRAYAEKTSFPTPLGGLMYHFHDILFGIGSAMMSGDGDVALQFVRQFNQDFPAPATYDPRAQQAAMAVWEAYGRFAPPAEVLAAPGVAAAKPNLEAMRHYARGEADLRLGRVSDARAEAERVAVPGDGPAVVKIAGLVLRGDADLQAGKPAEAAESFRAAATLQDRFTQSDPPPWWFPVRRSLAEALMRQGDAAGAMREATLVLQFWKRDPVTLEIRARAREALHQPGAAEDHRLAVEGWRGKVDLAKVPDGKA